jgi:hypothetical protein
MSGGPTLTAGSRIAGVNVAKAVFAEQVSFWCRPSSPPRC